MCPVLTIWSFTINGDVMNERIAKLYNQSLVLEGNGDYVAGELDPVKFAELIVRECARVCSEQRDPANLNYKPSEQFAEAVKQHFGVY